MKKTKFIIMAMVAIVMCVSCKKEDSGKNSPEMSNEESSVIGKWVEKQIEYEGKTYSCSEFQEYAKESKNLVLTSLSMAAVDMTFDLKSDKTCVLTQVGQSMKGSWSVSNQDVMIKFEKEIVSLKHKDGKLFYTISMPNFLEGTTETINVIFEKQ